MCEREINSLRERGRKGEVGGVFGRVEAIVCNNNNREVIERIVRLKALYN